MDTKREKFEKWLIKEFKLKTYDYALHFIDGEYQCTPTQARWQAWQQAQKVAVPDGFVLVEKNPSEELVNYGHQVFLGHFNEGGQTGGRALYFAYKAMIEVREPTND